MTGRNGLITLAGCLVLSIAGCASEETPTVTVSPVPSPTTASPAPSPKPGQFPNAQSPDTKPSPAARVSGLIPPTNVEEREKQIQSEIKGNKANDPFSVLPPELPQPTVTDKPIPNVAQLPGNRPNGSPTGNNGGTPQRPTTNNGGAPQRPTTNNGGAAQRPNTDKTGTGTNSAPIVVTGIPPERGIGESPTIPQPEGADEGAIGTYIPPVRPAAPPAPTAEAAQAIEVTGVVTVGRTPQAIVQLPEEPSNRYVSVGQRISNGKVLVKRIEMNAGSEPVVVFEQNGIEVAKSVGEKAAPKPDKVS